VDLEAEAGKHAVEGWNDLLVAHLGHAGATLVWTLLWVAGAVLALVFARYVGVLGAGEAAEGTPERLAYENLRTSLNDGGSPTRDYGRLLMRFLDGVDRFLGDHDKADLGVFRHAFGLRGDYPLWTGAALDRCLLIASFYPILSVLIIWAVSGHVGLAEEALGLGGSLPGWRRAAWIGGIALVGVSSTDRRPPESSRCDPRVEREIVWPPQAPICGPPWRPNACRSERSAVPWPPALARTSVNLGGAPWQ
jgi:hypothetical protein